MTRAALICAGVALAFMAASVAAGHPGFFGHNMGVPRWRHPSSTMTNRFKDFMSYPRAGPVRPGHPMNQFRTQNTFGDADPPARAHPPRAHPSHEELVAQRQHEAEMRRRAELEQQHRRMEAERQRRMEAEQQRRQMEAHQQRHHSQDILLTMDDHVELTVRPTWRMRPRWNVALRGNALVVEEYVRRGFNKRYTIGPDIDIDRITRSSLQDGSLRVVLPFKEKVVPETTSRAQVPPKRDESMDSSPDPVADRHTGPVTGRTMTMEERESALLNLVSHLVSSDEPGRESGHQTGDIDGGLPTEDAGKFDESHDPSSGYWFRGEWREY